MIARLESSSRAFRFASVLYGAATYTRHGLRRRTGENHARIAGNCDLASPPRIGTRPPHVGVTENPLVSVCLPVYNGAELVGRAIDSALNQAYEPLEIVVVDNRSSDGTPEIVRARYGDRVRLHVNPRNLGLVGNHDSAVLHSQGQFLKFMHHDDYLTANCIPKMVDALVAHPSAGLVFSRRGLELAGDTSETARWAQTFGQIHAQFPRLHPINSGPALFSQWLFTGFPENWVGEPIAVMVRRSALKTVGLFNRHTRHLMDIDLWMRIMAHYDAAFLDEELVTYRHSAESGTARTAASGEHWLDPLWMLEALNCYPELVARHPELRDRRRAERRRALRAVVRGTLRLQQEPRPLRSWLQYQRYRTRMLIHRRTRPFQSLRLCRGSGLQ
jgi:glycosyltransferase involved in cell wall biosynthesis